MVEGGSGRAPIRTSATWTSKHGALPLFHPLVPQTRTHPPQRPFFFLSGWLQTEDLARFNSNLLSLLFTRGGRWPVRGLNSVSDWQWNDREKPFDYQVITLWCLFLLWARKKKKKLAQIPHLFATTECSEVCQDWTVILSQKQRQLARTSGG